jgi:3',5'-cyclic AMP phosphodiesterase CpdA
VTAPAVQAPVRLLHASDLHFGWPAALERIEALDALIARERFDVVAISGDLAQRARAGEFQRARVFLDLTARVSAVITVPGNHDVAWWFAPLGMGDRDRLYAKYRRYIAHDLEPVLRVPGATFVGVNTAHGVTWGSLTLNPRDVSIIGNVEPRQLERVAREFAGAPAGDAKVVVMHHNPTRGELSNRYGITRPRGTMAAFNRMGVNLVLCGHDHQEAIHDVGGTVVVTAGTLSERTRGGRPASVDVCTISTNAIEVRQMVWESDRFVAGPVRCFAR